MSERVKTMYCVSVTHRATNLSLSESCHSGALASRNLFVREMSDKVAAVADIITTTGQKAEAGLEFLNSFSPRLQSA